MKQELQEHLIEGKRNGDINMKILVIGTGAVGCAIAIAAADAGMETAVLARANTASYIREHGLMRTGIFGEKNIAPDRIAVYEDYDQIPSGFDYIAVASKTMANKTVADSLAAYRDIVGSEGRIVLFQNGWGNDEPYLVHFPVSQVFNARVITGFERTDQLEEALWAKMLYNTTLNPLGAILNMSYGELAASEHLVSIMNSLIEETFAVIDAAGYKTFWKTPKEYMDVFYGKLVPDTVAHRASTLQDIEKRQKTEIDTLNGCVQKIGRKYGVKTPTHDMIVEMIKGIEDIRC